MTRIDPAVWGPAEGRGWLCVDTSGLFAYFYPADVRHGDARAFFEWLRGQDTAPWRLFVNDYVVDELCSLLGRKSGPETAIRALTQLRASEALAIIRVPEAVFERAMDTFAEFDDQTISFTDHVVSAHAAHRDAAVYTFDQQDFAVLGNEVVPRAAPET